MYKRQRQHLLHKLPLMRLQRYNHFIYQTCLQQMLQIFISAKAAAQFRALNPAHISIHRKTQMRMLLNVFDILLCKMAVAHHNHMFLVIAQLAVMPQDSTHTDALCRCV